VCASGARLVGALQARGARVWGSDCAGFGGLTVWWRMCHYRVVSKGKITVRMPPALHEQLERDAVAQGVSLNALIVALLAGGVGFRLTAE
jgi:hypothetical protein